MTGRSARFADSRLEDLENPARAPITVYRQSPRAASLKRGLSHKDSEIVDRLEALKAERHAIAKQ